MRYVSKREPLSVVDQFFKDIYYPETQSRDQWRSFAVDAQERDDSYMITADLPGFTHKDLNITVEDSVLTISASKEQIESAVETYMIHERRGGQFRRSFELPSDAKLESIQARLEKGVLNLLVERKEEAQPRKIQING